MDTAQSKSQLRPADREPLEPLFTNVDVFSRHAEGKSYFDCAETEVARQSLQKPKSIFGRALDVDAEAEKIGAKRLVEG